MAFPVVEPELQSIAAILPAFTVIENAHVLPPLVMEKSADPAVAGVPVTV